MRYLLVVGFLAAGCGGDEGTNPPTAPEVVVVGEAPGDVYWIEVDGLTCLVYQDEEAKGGYGFGVGAGISCDWDHRRTSENP